jgi:hypothetical protein
MTLPHDAGDERGHRRLTGPNNAQQRASVFHKRRVDRQDGGGSWDGEVRWQGWVFRDPRRLADRLRRVLGIAGSGVCFDA